MSDKRTIDAIDEIALYASEALKEDEEETISPIEVYENILPKSKTVGDVQLIEEPKLYADSREEILSTEPWIKTYGLDASSFPRTWEFVGGAKMNVANATLGHRNGKNDVTYHRSIFASLLFNAEDEAYTQTTISNKSYSSHGKSSTVQADVVRVPPPSERGSARDWVTTAALKFAEGKHLQRHVDDLDGALFIDGPIYPTGVARNALFTEIDTKATSDEWGEIHHDILELYGQSLEKQILSGHPVYGVVKTFRTRELVDSIYEKTTSLYEPGEVKIPWGNDASFISELLRYTGTGNMYTHTSWMARPFRSMEGRMMRVFEQTNLESLTPEDLARAFFYVKNPKGMVFRIEVPYVLVKNTSEEVLEETKQYILWELAKTEDVPQAILNADSDASLSRELRDHIMEKVKSRDAELDYNRDYRWKSINYTGD